MLSQEWMRAARATTAVFTDFRPRAETLGERLNAARARRYWLQWLTAGVVLCWWLQAACAHALPDKYRLAVLALTSDAIGDPFADRLANELRETLDARSDYALQNTRVSLRELSERHECSASDGECLAIIAQSLGVDGFVFGDVRHEPGGTLASLQRYDLWSGTIDRDARATFSSSTPRRDELERNSKRLVDELVGPAPALSNPSELVAPVAPQLETPGDLAPAEALSASTVAGYALLGGAVLSTGMSVLALVEVNRAEHSREYERYRVAVAERGGTTTDICEEAAAGKQHGLSAASFREVRNACSRASTLEILQFVFLGSAVVSGGLAAYFLTSSETPKERPKLGNDRWSLHPSFARSGFGLGARVRF